MGFFVDRIIIVSWIKKLQMQHIYVRLDSQLWQDLIMDTQKHSYHTIQKLANLTYHDVILNDKWANLTYHLDTGASSFSVFSLLLIFFNVICLTACALCLWTSCLYVYVHFAWGQVNFLNLSLSLTSSFPWAPLVRRLTSLPPYQKSQSQHLSHIFSLSFLAFTFTTTHPYSQNR